jgi:DNA-binding transcriptional LysR family regulator
VLLRQLEYFVAVARERHFARAAESCYVSQPALSTSIAKLERELSVTLINRGQNFEGLTPEGERLVVWAKRVLAEHDALKAEAAAMRSGISASRNAGSSFVMERTPLRLARSDNRRVSGDWRQVLDAHRHCTES